MGHIANPDKTYRLLQQRLDRNIMGAPNSEGLMRILRLLFSPEDADLARRIPSYPVPLHKVAAKVGIPESELDGRLTEMARRGIIMDIEYKGARYFMLAPVVIGFFEFTFMRARDDLPQAELARLFEEYMGGDGRFARTIFAGQTQVGRSLVHEEALPVAEEATGSPEDDHTEILDWERSSYLVQSASTVGLSLCACRHKKSHLGTACGHEQDNCLSLNAAADSMIRNGFSRRITRAEGMRVLEDAKRAGLAQTGDNVQRNVNYICNCCGCCCGMVQAIRTFNLRGAIVTSNWIMSADPSKCTGCGLCAKACPVEAIALVEVAGSDRPKKRAEAGAGLCLGCGVCYSACKSEALSMKPRPQRVVTPESVFERVVMMAIERGKLANLLFENSDGLTYRAMGRVLNALENSPPAKALLAIKPLRSAFLESMLSKARRLE